MIVPLAPLFAFLTSLTTDRHRLVCDINLDVILVQHREIGSDQQLAAPFKDFDLR